jgi:type II secretory ATPase GspE/PulE/Tfp pilus assembly ATPase PilB-like protein
MSLTADYMATDAALVSADIGHLVNCMIEDAIKGGASDIHIEPWESGLAVRIRLNGVLTELVELPLELMEKVSGRFKVMADLVSYKSGLPQEVRVARRAISSASSSASSTRRPSVSPVS